MDDTALPTGGPFTLAADGGAAFWFLGSLVVVKATGETTQGSFSLFEHLSPADWGPPRHVHPADDELVYVLEGTVEFEVGETTSQATAGSTVYLPHGVPHAWRTTEQTRRLQVTYEPGFEGLFAEMGRPAERLELPSEPTHPPDAAETVERMRDLAPTYGFEVFGPPMGSDS